MSDQSLIQMSMALRAITDDDGNVLWQTIASDTGLDRLGEQTSHELFTDWKYRIDNHVVTDWLPWQPRMPFLSVAHYPSLDGYGEAGIAQSLFQDGEQFGGIGTFADSEIGQEVRQALTVEQSLVEKGQFQGDPIRISAAWFDIAHRHGDYVFTRKSLNQKCPLCEAKVGGKVYMQGQLDHFAATRVPINPRTSLAIMEEKSMANKITRLDDAASIVSSETAKKLDDKQRQAMAAVGKSDTVDPVLVVKSEEETEVTEESETLTIESPDEVTATVEQSATVEKNGFGDDEIAAPYNPYRSAYKASAYMPGASPTSFDDLEADEVQEEQCEAMCDVFSKLQTIAMGILQNGSLPNRPDLLVQALSDALDRASDIVNNETMVEQSLTEKAVKTNKKAPMDDDSVFDFEDDDEEDMPKKKSFGGDSVNLVERAATLGNQLDQIAAGTGDRQAKYTATQQAVEGFLDDVQAVIDTSTPEVQQSAAPTGSGADVGAQVAQALGPLMQQMIDGLAQVNQSMALGFEKVARQQQPVQQPIPQPVQRSIPAQVYPQPVAQVDRASTQGLVVGQAPSNGSLRSMIRAQYGLPNTNQ